MQVFLYEYVTGGGFFGSAETGDVSPSLLREGAAMAAALAADLLGIDGVEVLMLRDARLRDHEFAKARWSNCTVRDVRSAEEEQAALCELAAAADGTIVIAPESDGALLCRTRIVAEVGRLLSPLPEFVRVASDKHLTAQRLSAAGVPTPQAIVLEPDELLPAHFQYPAVIKPCDGAGSQDVRLLQNAAAGRPDCRRGRPMRLEQLCAGVAASVAVLCGPGVIRPLPACRQHLSTDGRFQYLGGQLLLDEQLRRRAAQLAVAAVRALASAQGYVGVDLVLGAAADGSDDVVIEINPRLTTSYVGLRVAARQNLARAMLQIAAGQPAELSFDLRRLEFTADGRVSRQTEDKVDERT